MCSLPALNVLTGTAGHQALAYQASTLVQRARINVAREARAAAAELPPGKQRDQLIRKASQHETAANIDDWPSSAGLTPQDTATELHHLADVVLVDTAPRFADLGAIRHATAEVGLTALCARALIEIWAHSH